MSPIVVRHNALLVASEVGGLCTTVAVIASALRKPLPFSQWPLCNAEIPSLRTGPLVKQPKRLFTLSEASVDVITALVWCSFSLPWFEFSSFSFTFCSYHKHWGYYSGSLPLPLALSGGPVWSQAAPLYCALPVVSPHSVHSERCNLDVHTSHQGSFICTCSPGFRTLSAPQLILPLAEKRNLKHIFSTHPILVPFS